MCNSEIIHFLVINTKLHVRNLLTKSIRDLSDRNNDKLCDDINHSMSHYIFRIYLIVVAHFQ